MSTTHVQPRTPALDRVSARKMKHGLVFYVQADSGGRPVCVKDDNDLARRYNKAVKQAIFWSRD